MNVQVWVAQMAMPSVRFSMWSRKLSNVGRSLDRWPKIYYLELLRAWDVKPLVPATFTAVSTHQSALGPRDELWSVILILWFTRKCCVPAHPWDRLRLDNVEITILVKLLRCLCFSSSSVASSSGIKRKFCICIHFIL
jgi:hypothetical protein